MEGERKSVKQQPLSSAQATEDADVTGDWAFVNPLPVGQSTRGGSV